MSMACNLQIFALVIFLLATTANGSTDGNAEVQPSAATTSDLDAAEANGKLEIIKQIKKVNEDGSYTIGYEADDGSFKIESRDVLGNIKGTYGYIDDNGDIKRVSYSSSNNTEGITSTSEPISVVQRIPSKVNRTTPTTRRPYIISSTSATSTSTSPSVQPIPRRRLPISTTSTTTVPPTSTAQFIKEALAASKATVTPSTLLYETSTPARLLAQSKPLVRSTVTAQKATTSEGQLLRPEVLLKTTDMPLYRRLPIKTTLLDEDTKPVTEEPEVRSNVLRRQLPPISREDKGFDARQHVINVQQSSGDDTVDVYSASVTTGSPRPLFTTLRPRIVTTTVAPIAIHRPTPPARYPSYQRGAPIARAPAPTTEYPQESATEPTVTPSPVPVVQIPANAAHRDEPQRQQFVELRHPYHRGAILVPVNSHLERRIPQEIIPYQAIQAEANGPNDPVYAYRRVPKFRPIPVQVDENGYIREYSTPNPYVQNVQNVQAPQRTVTLEPYISQNDIINEVDQIKPPVSTKDFQKLLEQLILRQTRLEKISALTRNSEFYRRPYQDPYQQQPVHYVPRTQTAQPQQQHPVIVRPAQPIDEQAYNNYAPVTFTPAPASNSYHPTKRMVRVNPHNQHLHQEQTDEEYLPAPVREMLLLRMLQLAINPSLPVEVMDNLESATTPLPRKEAVRNVEILGEDDDAKRPSRTKRYKQLEFDYYD